MSKICIVSGDGHAGPKVAEFKTYLESKYWENLKDAEQEEREFLLVTEGQSRFTDEQLDAIDSRNAIRSGGQSGAWDPTRRVQEMDAEGVVAEIIHQGHQNSTMPFFSITNRPHPPELRAAGAKAYHRWLADHMAQTDGRAFGVAEPGPCIDIKETVKDLPWLIENGFVSVGVPGGIKDETLPPLYDSYYEPFWSACEELGLVLSVHAGWGFPQGVFFGFMEMMTGGQSIEEAAKEGKFIELGEQLKNSRRSPNAIPQESRRALWQLMLGGVFDRHPNLKLAFTEIRAEWVPATLKYLDEKLPQSGATLKLKPSEYFQRNCYVAPSSTKIEEVGMRYDIGVDRFMFGTDYPHPEGTWPNTWDWLRTVFSNIPESEARKILGENAIECYNLDHTKFMAIAEKIGPNPNDILGPSHHVDEKFIEDFDRRAGFKVPVEEVSLSLLENLVEEDLSGMAVNK